MAAIELATCQAMVLYDCSRRVHHIWVTKMNEGKMVLFHHNDAISSQSQILAAGKIGKDRTPRKRPTGSYR